MTNIFEDYVSVATANWDTDIIDLPTIFNWEVQKWARPPSIGVETLPSTLPPGDGQTQTLKRAYNANLHLYAYSEPDLEKLLEANLDMFYKYSKMWVSREMTDKRTRTGYVTAILRFTELEIIPTTAW